MKRRLALIGVLMLIGLAAWAQEQTPRADRRQANQRHRIRQGWAEGDLTRREAARLMVAQQHIRRAACMAKADGRVTRAERMRMHYLQTKQSRQIFRERHDRQFLHH